MVYLYVGCARMCGSLSIASGVANSIGATEMETIANRCDVRDERILLAASTAATSRLFDVSSNSSTSFSLPVMRATLSRLAEMFLINSNAFSSRDFHSFDVIYPYDPVILEFSHNLKPNSNLIFLFVHKLPTTSWCKVSKSTSNVKMPMLS